MSAVRRNKNRIKKKKMRELEEGDGI